MSSPNLKIVDNEKYALAAYKADIASRFQHHFFSPNIWIETKNPVEFDQHWREWMGSIRTEHFEESNFLVFAKKASDTSNLLDQESESLKNTVINFHFGLLLAGRLHCYEKPLLITGGKDRDELSIRQLQEIETPIQFSAISWDTIDLPFLERAFTISKCIAKVWDGSSRFKRLRRILNIYFTARMTPDILDRLHQYARCIEGLILPNAGDTTRQFKSRTELFIGPRHHSLMKEIYEARNAIEHLNDHLNVSSKTREDRAQIYKWAHIAEHVARCCLTKIAISDTLRHVYESDDTLRSFWLKDLNERQAIWGEPINPLEAISSFEIRNLSNAELGL